jgi:hypothetical protein
MTCLPLNFGENKRPAMAGSVNIFHLIKSKTLLAKNDFSWGGAGNGFLKNWKSSF